MIEPKWHEPPEVVAAYLDSCLEVARRLCLHSDERIHVSGPRLLRELYRARRSGWMTPEQRRRYDGLLKVVRPHVRAMKERGLKISAVVESELERAHAGGRRPTG